jgi:hypothetical protein
VAARTQRVDDVADWRSGTLRLARVCKGVAAPPGRATSTCSRLLYDTLGVVYDWLGFDIVDDPVFRDLVIARLVEPTSKADAARVLTDLGAETVSYKTIQRPPRADQHRELPGCDRGPVLHPCRGPGRAEPAALRRDDLVFRGRERRRVA